MLLGAKRCKWAAKFCSPLRSTTPNLHSTAWSALPVGETAETFITREDSEKQILRTDVDRLPSAVQT